MSRCQAARASKSATHYIAHVENEDSQGRFTKRSWHDRLQHRHHTRSLRHLHHQLFHGHRLRPGQPEGRPRRRQLSNTSIACGGASPPRCRRYRPTSGRRSRRFGHQQGLPAPLDIQISSNDQQAPSPRRRRSPNKLRGLSSVGDVYIPQDLKYPGLQLNIDRERASLVGLSPKDVVDNVITALTSNGVIAPSYWIDPNTGNNYMLTVQYSTHQIEHMNMEEFENIPLRGKDRAELHAAALGRLHQTHRHTHRGRSLSACAASSTSMCSRASEALNTVSRQVNHISQTSTAHGHAHHRPWRGRKHERLLHPIRHRLHSRHRAHLSRAHGAIRLIPRSVHHPYGHSAWTRWRRAHPAHDRLHTQHHVADGRHHDDRHRRLELASSSSSSRASFTPRAKACSMQSCNPARSVCAPS